MTAKEAIQAQLERLSEQELIELHQIIEQFVRSKGKEYPGSLMEQLRCIEIDGPEDFPSNLDAYLSGEKRVQQNPG